MSNAQPVAMALRDRPEYASKPKPLTFAPSATVSLAVKAMSERNFGSVVVTDSEERILGIVTERDIMKRVVNENRDPSSTKLEEIMTADPRVAQESDDLVDWLRIMSNERFRRLPVVDEQGRVKVVFTQGDFVAYTWPDLIYQAKELAKAGIFRQWGATLIGGAVVLYTVLMVILISVIT